MNPKRYKPLIDKLFCITALVLLAILAAATVIPALSAPKTLFLMVPLDLFVLYFLASPLFGYVELWEDSLFIKYGFLLKKEIPYNKIRSLEKGRSICNNSIMSLKNALDHVNIKYNKFDVTTISVVGNDDLIREIEARRAGGDTHTASIE